MHNTLVAFTILAAAVTTSASYLLFTPLAPPRNFAEMAGDRTPNGGSSSISKRPSSLPDFLLNTSLSPRTIDFTATASALDSIAEGDDAKEGAEAEKEEDGEEAGKEKEETGLDRLWAAPKLG